MTKQLFIPETIKVGYQERDDTYTKKLAYVIYYDAKGKLRKEASWESWCDLPGNPGGYHRYGEDYSKHKGIKPNDYENVPTEGFVLNKKVGGHSSGWNHRNAYTRVFDPRGFEFEISVENLLFILAEGDCTRGKGLEGKFVYSWHGTELVLLPTHCEDYKNCAKFTSLQGLKVSARDLIPGATYETKTQGTLVYIGRMYSFDVARVNSYREEATNEKIEKARKKAGAKSHIFYNPSTSSYEALKSMTSLAKCTDAECHPDFAELLEEYDVSFKNTPIASMRLVRLGNDGSDNYMELNGKIRRCSRNRVNYTDEGDKGVFDVGNDYYYVGDTYSLKDGVLCDVDEDRGYTDIVHCPGFTKGEYSRRNSYSYGWHNRNNTNRFHEMDVTSKTPKSLVVTLENGKQFVYNGYSGFKLYKDKK